MTATTAKASEWMTAHIREKVAVQWKRDALWTNLYMFGSCPKCKRTWDACQCRDRDKRFDRAFAAQWKEIANKEST